MTIANWSHIYSIIVLTITILLPPISLLLALLPKLHHLIDR